MDHGPNLLFIISDQHAQRVAGCYGDGVVQTPHLDRLAAAGVVFDNAYTPSPVCVPARMSLLTGRYPYEHHCWGNNNMLASDMCTISHALGAAGVAPILVGRMDSKGPDQLHGYVRRDSGEHSSNWWGKGPARLGMLNRANGPCRESIVMSGSGQSSYILKDEHTTTAACALLEELAAERAAGKDGRFAITVGYILPHHPFVARAADFNGYNGKVGMPKHPVPANEHPFHAWWRKQSGSDFSDEASWVRARTAYYALVTAMDRMIGHVLDTLKATGLADNTLVIYTTDHGEQLGERGLWWKQTFYDDSAKIPLIMSWPGVLPAGQRRNNIVNLIDVSATMLNAMGAPPLPHMRGRSLLGVAKDARSPWLNETYSEFVTDGLDDVWMGDAVVQQRMIRSGRWKLSCYFGSPAGPPQLFNLVDDPEEKNDLAGRPQHAAMVQALTEKIHAGWDPEEIRRITDAKARDFAVIRTWTRRWQPDDVYYWPTNDADNWLDAQKGA
jgi:choline-sulfatase